MPDAPNDKLTRDEPSAGGHYRGKSEEKSATTPGTKPAPQMNQLWAISSMGMELTASIVGMTLLGWFADKHFGTAPVCLLVGLAMGLIGGGVNFMKRAIKYSKLAANGPRKRPAKPGAPAPPTPMPRIAPGRPKESSLFARKTIELTEEDSELQEALKMSEEDLQSMLEQELEQIEGQPDNIQELHEDDLADESEEHDERRD